MLKSHTHPNIYLAYSRVTHTQGNQLSSLFIPERKELHSLSPPNLFLPFSPACGSSPARAYFPAPFGRKAWPGLWSHQCNVGRLMGGVTCLPKRVLLPRTPAPHTVTWLQPCRQGQCPPHWSRDREDPNSCTILKSRATHTGPFPLQLSRTTEMSCCLTLRHMAQQLRLWPEHDTPEVTTALLPKWHSTLSNGSKQQCSRRWGKK